LNDSTVQRFNDSTVFLQVVGEAVSEAELGVGAGVGGAIEEDGLSFHGLWS
jgi:hypothetical protein